MFKPHLGHTYGIGLVPKPCGDSPFCSEAQRSEEEEVLFMSPLKNRNAQNKQQTNKTPKPRTSLFLADKMIKV